MECNDMTIIYNEDPVAVQNEEAMVIFANELRFEIMVLDVATMKADLIDYWCSIAEAGTGTQSACGGEEGHVKAKGKQKKSKEVQSTKPLKKERGGKPVVP